MSAAKTSYRRTHSSVGGGGERRGLSDQALDWVLDGARAVGLELDTSRHSRIYELAPNHAEFLDNSREQSLMYRTMNRFAAAPREGPTRFSDTSVFARRRWAASTDQLEDKVPYRPATLRRVKTELDAWAEADRAAAQPQPDACATTRYEVYVVKPGDTLAELARRYYGNTAAYPRIFDANRNKLDDPDKIFVGCSLRIPLH